jgi:hypothetical protein
MKLLDYILRRHGCAYEVYTALGCNALYFGDSQTFRRNISTSSSGSKGMPNEKPEEGGGKLSPDDFLLGLFLYPEDGGHIILLNDSLSLTYTALQLRRPVLMGTQITGPDCLLNTL